MKRVLGLATKIAAIATLCAVVVFGSTTDVKAQVSQDAIFAAYQNQAAVAAQQQAIANAQYQMALYAQQSFATQQSRAYNQSLLLQQMQFLQYQQYMSMIRAQGLDYQTQLLNQYRDNQIQAQQAFNGWNGVYYTYPVVVLP